MVIKLTYQRTLKWMLDWIPQVLPSQDKNIPHTAEMFDYTYAYVFVSLFIYHKARSKL